MDYARTMMPVRAGSPPTRPGTWPREKHQLTMQSMTDQTMNTKRPCGKEQEVWRSITRSPGAPLRRARTRIKKAYRKLRVRPPGLRGCDRRKPSRAVVAYERLDPEKRYMYDIAAPTLAVELARVRPPPVSPIFSRLCSPADSKSSPHAARLRACAEAPAGECGHTSSDAAPRQQRKCPSRRTFVRHLPRLDVLPVSSPETCTMRGSGFVTQIQNSLFGRMQTQAHPTCRLSGHDDPQSLHRATARVVPTRRTLSINIPAGASEGTQIRVSGEAGGRYGRRPQRRPSSIREKLAPRVDRRGDDLHIADPMTTAALGTEFGALTLLDGKKNVTIDLGRPTTISS